MKEDVICWDSSVFISWLRGNEGEDRDRAIRYLVERVEAGDYKVAVSTLLYVEVLESTMPAPAIGQFEKFMQNRAMISIVAVDIRVARKAQMIRDTLQKKDENITTPDAVHIATAIVSQAKFFHTFDARLLRLNGKSEVDGLTITACDIQ